MSAKRIAFFSALLLGMSFASTSNGQANGIVSNPRMTTFLQLAKNLEKLGKRDAAIQYYQQICSTRPEPREANEAMAALQRMGVKPDGSLPFVLTVPQTSPLGPPIRQTKVKPVAPLKDTRNFVPITPPVAIRSNSSSLRIPPPTTSSFSSTSSSHMCGATTLKGLPCRRMVKGPGNCYQH